MKIKFVSLPSLNEYYHFLHILDPSSFKNITAKKLFNCTESELINKNNELTNTYNEKKYQLLLLKSKL